MLVGKSEVTHSELVTKQLWNDNTAPLHCFKLLLQSLETVNTIPDV